MFEMTKRVARDAVRAVFQTPVEVSLGAFAAAFLSYTLTSPQPPEGTGEVLLTVALLWVVTFSLSALAALRVFDQKTRWLLTAVGTAAIGGYGATLLDVSLETEVWRYAFLVIGAVMGMMLVPVAARLGTATASERFWRFNMRLGFRFGVAGFYSLLLFVGVALGILAIDELFTLHLDDKVYGHLFSFIVLGVGTALAAGGLGEIVRIDQPFHDSSLKWGGRLGTFLFLPLLVLYLGIMYAYFGKVLLTGDVPSNILSPLALGAGILGFLGLFVLQPFMQRADFRPLAVVLRAFPAAFVPIVPLGLWGGLAARRPVRVDRVPLRADGGARVPGALCDRRHVPLDSSTAVFPHHGSGDCRDGVAARGRRTVGSELGVRVEPADATRRIGPHSGNARQLRAPEGSGALARRRGAPR